MAYVSRDGAVVLGLPDRDAITGSESVLLWSIGTRAGVTWITDSACPQLEELSLSVPVVCSNRVQLNDFSESSYACFCSQLTLIGRMHSFLRCSRSSSPKLSVGHIVICHLAVQFSLVLYTHTLSTNWANVRPCVARRCWIPDHV